jgi:hypothetical protein
MRNVNPITLSLAAIVACAAGSIATAAAPASTQSAQPHYSELLLCVPPAPYPPGKPNPPYPQPGVFVIRIFDDPSPHWAHLDDPELIPLNVGPHAANLLAFDRKSGRLLYFSSAQKKVTRIDPQPAGQSIDERGIWSTRVGSKHKWRYDLSQEKWLETDEPVPVEAPPPPRPLAANNARSFSRSPSGELGLLWIKAADDLIFGWRYTLMDLRTGRVLDRFAFNMKGGEHIGWAPCTRDELESSLRAMRLVLENRQ